MLLNYFHDYHDNNEGGSNNGLTNKKESVNNALSNDGCAYTPVMVGQMHPQSNTICLKVITGLFIWKLEFSWFKHILRYFEISVLVKALTFWGIRYRTCQRY